MANFLDLTTGLPALWAKIKSKFYTKAEVDALIPEIEQSDWDENTLTNQAYIQNKPAIKAGKGENSVMIGQIEQDANAVIYTIYVTGSGSTLSFTTEETLPSNNNIKYYGIYYDTVEGNYASIKAIDTSAGTISIDRAYGSAGVTNREVHIFYKYKITSGKYSYAEGNYSSALVDYSHAEGAQTRAAGTASHSEGNRTQANGTYSHAEGTITYANNVASHTEGSNTIASGKYQHVQGKYNIEDSEGVYADIVGNGSSSACSNAYTLDWSGNGWYAGKVTVGAAPTADMDVATKAYVDAATADASAPFIVTITKGYSQGDQEWWYNSNKNYSQIMEAYNAGQTCYAIDSGNLYYLAEAHNAYVLFTRLSVDNKKLYSYKITSSNDNLTYTYMNVPYNLNSLKDVNISSPTTGQVLTYASSGWKAADIATDLTGLTDTTISSPADGQVLSYNSATSKWVNTNTITETRVNELIAAALAQYGDGDTMAYGGV